MEEVRSRDGATIAFERCPDWMVDIGRRIADGMPEGRHRVLEGQEHVVPPGVPVPVLVEFFEE